MGGEGHAMGGARRRTPARRLMRPLAAVGAAMLAATVGLLLSNGASSPGLNIAAAAYAATSSGSGVLEARFVDSTFLAHGRVVTSHHREWIDASTGMRRERRTLPARHRQAPGRQPDESTNWPAPPAGSKPGTAPRAKAERDRSANRWYPRGIPHPGRVFHSPRGAARRAQAIPAGIATYRRLYRERSIRLVGRERRDGRLLWKLEGDVGDSPSTRSHAKLVPIMAVVVLVDPRTYLPVVQRTVNLLPGHRRQVQRKASCSATGACRAARRAKPC